MGIDYEYCPEVYLSIRRLRNYWISTKLIVGLILYHVDFTSDIRTAVEHFLRGDILWGCLTIMFIMYPPLVIGMWNMTYKLKEDKESQFSMNVKHLDLKSLLFSICFGMNVKHLDLKILLFSICFGPFHTSFTYICIVVDNIRGKDILNDAIYRVSVMKFTEALTESLPQTYLQMYIIAQALGFGVEISYVQWVSTIISILTFSLSICMDPSYICSYERSTISKVVFYAFGALAFTSRVMVCCMMSLVWHPLSLLLGVLPVATGVMASIVIWLIKRYCTLSNFTPLNEWHRASLLEGGLTYCVGPAWTLTAVFNSFTLSGLLMSTINLVFAMGAYWFSPPHQLDLPDLCLFRLLGICFALVSFVANTILATFPCFKQIREHWLCINEKGEGHLF